MEQLKIYLLNAIAFLFLQIGLAQENDKHIVSSPTKQLKMVLYSNGKPLIEGTVVAVGDKLINNGLFVVYDKNNQIIQTIRYDMGKIIKITNFSETEKM